MTRKPWTVLDSGRVVWTPKPPPSQGMSDVIAERLRQMDDEGWDADHDDQHTDGELAAAAACYAYSASIGNGAEKNLGDNRPGFLSLVNAMWPESWSWEWWKPKSKRHNLVRAAALLIAEIERMDRVAAISD